MKLSYDKKPKLTSMMMMKGPDNFVFSVKQKSLAIFYVIHL